MENAAKALEMAAAVLILVIALAMAMTVISQAREVADLVFYMKDNTNFAEYIDEDATNYRVSRIVGIDTVIPTIYRHYKEGFNVILKDRNDEIIQVFTTYTSFEDDNGNLVESEKLLNNGKYYGGISSNENNIDATSTVVALIKDFFETEGRNLLDDELVFEETFREREVEESATDTTIIDITYKIIQ